MAKIRLLVGYKNAYGKYGKAEKTFNDENHYNNWYRKFTEYNKIISEERL